MPLGAILASTFGAASAPLRWPFPSDCFGDASAKRQKYRPAVAYVGTFKKKTRFDTNYLKHKRLKRPSGPRSATRRSSCWSRYRVRSRSRRAGTRATARRFSQPSSAIWVTPHVAQNDGWRGRSAIDARTTRHAGYAISQRKKKRTEECFGWLKAIALVRRVHHRGTLKMDWVFIFACAAYDPVCMRNLSRATVQAG
jgi:hypothetical protein